MAYPYKTTVSGKSITITGMDSDGKYLLDGGEKLWIKPLKRETFRALTLKKISKLTHVNDEWLLDGKNQKIRIVDAITRRHESSGKAHTEMCSLDRLREELDALSVKDGAGVRGMVKGVALFAEHFDRVDGETAETCAVMNDDLAALTTADTHVKRLPLPPAKAFRPVLLTDYQIQQARQPHKKTKTRRPKLVARFENDYTVAVIPQKSGKETPLTIETELQEFIKKIVKAGGKLPLTKLREGKPTNYRPDKMLNSQNARALLKTGLFGKTRSGRTSTYWAKQTAN
jgi:hypothetical protein